MNLTATSLSVPAPSPRPANSDPAVELPADPAQLAGDPLAAFVHLLGALSGDTEGAGIEGGEASPNAEEGEKGAEAKASSTAGDASIASAPVSLVPLASPTPTPTTDASLSASLAFAFIGMQGNSGVLPTSPETSTPRTTSPVEAAAFQRGGTVLNLQLNASMAPASPIPMHRLDSGLQEPTPATTETQAASPVALADDQGESLPPVIAEAKWSRLTSGDALPAGMAITSSANTAAPTVPATAVKLPSGNPEQWRPALLEALGDRIRISAGKHGDDHAVIRLDPPMMGSVEVVIRHQAGNLQVQLSASNGEVARQLQNISESLRQDLVQRQYAEVSVHVSADGRNGQGRQQDGREEAAPGRALAEAEDGQAATSFTQFLASA